MQHLLSLQEKVLGEGQCSICSVYKRRSWESGSPAGCELRVPHAMSSCWKVRVLPTRGESGDQASISGFEAGIFVLFWFGFLSFSFLFSSHPDVAERAGSSLGAGTAVALVTGLWDEARVRAAPDPASFPGRTLPGNLGMAWV